MSAFFAQLDAALVANVCPLVWGLPGVGKTSAIQAWARERGLPCHVVIASQCDPTDFGGLPVVNRETYGVQLAPPPFAQALAETGGVLFLDELTTAPKHVQAALLRGLTDRTFGGLRLDPSKVAIIAAANPPDSACNGRDLDPPLSNRFIHLDYDLHPAAWCDAFEGYWGHEPSLAFGNAALSADAWRAARAEIAAFIRQAPGFLHVLPPDPEHSGRTWPSPRTWDMASRLIAQGLDEEAAVFSTVGPDAASAFLDWRDGAGGYDAAEALENPDGYPLPPTPSQMDAFLNACVRLALALGDDESLRKGLRLTHRAALALAPDIAYPAAQALAKAGSGKLDPVEMEPLLRPFDPAWSLK